MTSMREQTFEVIEEDTAFSIKEYYTETVDRLKLEIFYETNKGKKLATHRRIKRLSTQYQNYLSNLACSECSVIPHLAKFYNEPTPA